MFGVRRSIKFIFSVTNRKRFLDLTMCDLKRLESNAVKAEELLDAIKTELEEIKILKINKEITKLEKENSLLENKVAAAKQRLIQLEVNNGVKQIAVPFDNVQNSKDITVTQIDSNVVTKQDVNSEAALKSEKRVQVKPQIEKKEKKQLPNKVEADSPIDVRRLDFRVGKIIEITKHPDADSLYVEKIDCGETQPRTVVSGLVKYIPIEEMKDRMVVILCNLKPVKMRGITSEAMVMCASSPDKVEVLSPPLGAIPGDLVHCDGYPREPDVLLNPKKKIFETCAPDLLTNDKKVACYKGTPLTIPGKGQITSQTLATTHVR